MRKLLSSSLLLLGLCLSLVPASAGARDLVYGAWVGPKHGLMVYALPPFFDAVRKDTQGAVNWKLVTGGTLVSGRTTLAGIRDGIVDAGLIIPSYTAKELPGNNLVMGVEVFGEDTVAASAAAMETVMRDCPQCLEDFHKQNAVFLAGHAATPFYLMCKPTIKSIADLAGKKIRASGAEVGLVRMLGAIPTPMSPAEGLTSMERGTIDCVFGAIAWLQSYSYQDVVTNVVDYPLGIVGGLGTLVMNRKSWNSLTHEQKMAHIRNLPSMCARGIIQGYVEADVRARKAAEAKGIKFVKVDTAAFDALVKKFKAGEDHNLIETATKLGMKDPEPVLAAYRRNLAKWQALSPSIGLDVDKYAAAIKREIYDKIDPDKM